MIFRNYINFRKSTLLLLLVALTIFVTLGTISATDVNNDSAAIDGGVIYGKFYQDNDSIAVENFENSNNNISFSDKEILGSAGDGTFTDLQKMINNARAGSTISLEKNYIYNQGFSTDGITINKALTINGNGHTIDASGQSRIFNTNSELTFDNIVFKNGKTMDGGAAIKTERFLFIKNSIFMGNDAYDGGAIYSSKNINVTNCIFMNNKADGSGFNQCEGGAIWTEEGTVEVDNSTFIGNYAYDYGGAIYANTVHTNSKSYFINNTVDDNKGGAIFTWNAYIVGTIFEGNAAYLRGGAIYNVRGITVINSTFRNNKAEGASVSQCGGGAIFTSSDEATVSVDNCTFIGNHAADYGGAIYGLYSCYISSSTFIGNYADDNCGGAIYAYRDELGTLWTMQMTIYDSIFDGNHAYDDGGAIYTNVVSVCVSNSIFRNNYADGASSSQCYGGAILVEGDTSYSGARSLQINNATFIGNHAHDYGGAVYADVVGWGDAPSYFINNYVEDNQGGAIYANKFSNDVSRAVFIGNEVRANDDGGAIYINKANSLTFSQCYFERNKCGDEGGAIYLDSRSSVISLKNNVFIDNSAGDKGQIVYNWGDYGEISENWYGTNNPSFNDQFKEWGFFRDDDHSDSNYVITKLSLSDNPRVGHTYNLTVDFLSKNSAKLSGNLFGFDAKFSADNGAEISNHQIGTNNVTSEITFWSAGLTTINATVNKQDLKLLYNPTKENVTMNITAPEITVGEDTVVNISFMPDTATGLVIVGNRSFSDIENGLVSTIISDLPVDIYNFSVVYSGDRAYNSAQDSVIIVVNRKDLNIGASAIPIYINDNATVVVTGLEDATGNVTVTIGDKYWSGEITGGTTSVIVPGLTGNVTANVTYRGDNNHNNASTTVDIIVNKEPKKNLTNMVAGAESIHAPDDAIIVVTGLEDATGNVTVTIGDKYWSGEITDGTAIVIVGGLTENVTANVFYAGDYRYNNASATVDIVVYPPIYVWYVDGNRNSSGNGTSKETAFKTLNEAVKKAPDGSTIYIMPATYIGDNNVGLFINQNLSLVNYGGGEVIFDAQGLCRILAVNAESINITGLTFKNGNEEYVAGAIFFNQTLNNSIINATFINNTVMYGVGGAIAFYSGINNSVINSVFINNHVIDGDGGVIYFNGDLNNVTIGGTYNNNSAGYAGVFYFYRNSTDVILSGDYANNMASEGAVIFSEGNIMNSIISGNYINNTAGSFINFIFIASNVSMSGNYVNNTVLFDDGIIYVLGGENDTIVHDSIFINNNVDDGFIIDVIGSISAVNNWFGNNATNYNATPNVSQNVTLINWLFLNATANPTELKINETSEITFKLYSYNNASEEISEYDASKMNIKLDLNQTSGTLSKDSVLINETVMYNCTGEGIASVTGKFETASYTIILAKAPTEIIVNKTDITLNVSESVSAEALLIPAEAGNLTYTSSNETVAVVVDGKIKALAAGTANITVSFTGDETYAAAKNQTITVTVTLNDARVSVNNETVDLKVEDNFTIVATTVPGGLNVNYTSSDESVTTVDADGKILAVGEGRAVITVSVGGDGIYALNSTNVTVTVSKVPSEISVNPVSLDLIVGNESVIVANLTPADAGNVTFTSSDKNIATVDAQGNVIAVGEGSAVVTVSFTGDSKYAAAENVTVSVSVAPKPKNATISIDAPSEATEGDNVTVTVTLPEDATGIVTIGNEVIPVQNGTASAVLTNIPAGNTTISITYSGDDKYNSIETTVNITVNVKPAPAKENLIISASANPIAVGEDAVVVVTGFEDATGNVTAKVGNGVYTAPIINGTATFTVSGLIENVTANITYSGDDKYNNASTAVDIVVNPKPKENATIVIDAPSQATEGDNIAVTVTLPEDATGTVTIGNGVVTVQNGTASAVLTNIPAGNTTVPVTYSGDDKYNSIETSVNVMVNPQPVPPKEDLNVSVVADPITVGENAFIVVNGLADATGNVGAVVNGKTYAAPINDGKATITVSGLTENATALISYLGDDKYNNFTESVDIVVNPKEKENATIVIDAPSEATEGDNVTVTVTLPEDATGSVSIGNGVIPVQNGTASAVLTNIPVGNTTVPITYSGDDKYNPIETEVTINVDEKSVPPKEDLNASVNVDSITVGEDAVIVVSDLKDATGNVTAVVNGKTYAAPINDGKATITVSGLTENATALISYHGDDKYNNFTESVDITVNPKENATMNINVPSVTEGQNTTVNVELPKDATGNVTAVVDGKTDAALVKDGKATITIPDLAAGNYTVSVTYSGDNKYNSLTEEVKITVDEDKSDIIKAPDVTKYFGGSERFVVTVTDYLGKPLANKSVTISINGRSYDKSTDVNGTASIALGLNSGVYNATVTVDNKTINSVVTILSTVNGTDIIKVFRNATQYYATFRDGEGNYLKDGETVIFNIHGVMYERKVSGDNGLARLNINLEAGEYVITAMNQVTGDKTANNITVLSRIIENADLVKYYRNASQYSVKIIGDDGKAVGAGESVTFNINGVLYTRQTDANGAAKLNINLQPGDYVITAEYKGCLASNNIKVLPVLTANDISMKYRDGTQFKAILVDGQGKPYANQSVIFNINGVFYNRPTDGAGTAKLNINLMPGEYIITSSYNGSSIGNKITIKG